MTTPEASRQAGREMVTMGPVEPVMTSVPCAFCRGTGKDPFGIMSWLSTCCVCGGRGVVSVRAPYVPCAHCRGRGAIKTFTCTVCGGKGLVAAFPGPTVTCPDCRGTGDAVSALACLTCRGRGWIPQASPPGQGRSAVTPLRPQGVG